MVIIRSSENTSMIEKGQIRLKIIMQNEAVHYIDVGWKPNIVKNKYLRTAMAKEYSRRLRLELKRYSPKRLRKYTKKDLLDLSWRQLEKINESLKGQRSRKMKRGRKRKTRRRRRC